jgi:excinuclease ABC subunit C
VGEERPAERIERSPERVFLPGQKNAIVLRQNSAELFVLTRLRDEAHRFANVLHDKLRRRRSLRSALEDVAGVGQKRHRALLRQFGSLKRLEAASEAEIAAVEGMNASAAKAVYALLHSARTDDVAGGEREPESDESDERLTDDAFADFED